MKKLRISGPVGEIESLYEEPSSLSPAIGICVIAHPHPQHGGTMENKVVHSLAQAFREEKIITLRFNYRGVGHSSGQYDYGVGEAEDMRWVIRWLQQRHPSLPLWLAGFSFGAAISLVIAHEYELSGLVTVAPPVNHFEVEHWPRCSWMLLIGEQDELVAVQEVRSTLKRWPRQPILRVLNESGHFFHGKLKELQKEVREFIQQASTLPRGKKEPESSLITPAQ